MASHPWTLAGRLLRARLGYHHQDGHPSTDSHGAAGVGRHVALGWGV